MIYSNVRFFRVVEHNTTYNSLFTVVRTYKRERKNTVKHENVQKTVSNVNGPVKLIRAADIDIYM